MVDLVGVLVVGVLVVGVCVVGCVFVGAVISAGVFVVNERGGMFGKRREKAGYTFTETFSTKKVCCIIQLLDVILMRC